MCEPTTMAYVAVAASVASGAMTAYGQVQQGKQAKAMANYQSQVASNNAKRAEYLAEDALKRGEEAEHQQRLKGRLLVGQMRAVLGSSGQVIDEGSAGDLVIDQAAVNELDALNVRSNYEREAYGYRAEAANFESEASLFQLEGSNAQRSANLAAAGTLLSTAGDVAGKWYGFSSDGVFGGSSRGGTTSIKTPTATI